MPHYNNAAVDNLFASDAEFRTYIQAVEAALLSTGFLVHKSDETGQIDPTSVVRPAISTAAGYRMYKAADSLQATKPLFVKVEYGCGTSTARPLVRMTCSTNTNGAGTQSGFVSTQVAPISASADGSGAARIFAAGDDTHVAMFIWDPGISTQCGSFLVGRPVLRSDKSATGDFCYFSFVGGSSGTLYSSFYYCDFGGSWSSFALDNQFPNIDGAPNTGGDVNVVYLFDAIMYRNGVILTFPWVLGRNAEVPYTDPDGGQFSISVWGATRTFTRAPWSSMGASGVGVGCFIWEA